MPPCRASATWQMGSDGCRICRRARRCVRKAARALWFKLPHCQMQNQPNEELAGSGPTFNKVVSPPILTAQPELGPSWPCSLQPELGPSRPCSASLFRRKVDFDPVIKDLTHVRQLSVGLQATNPPGTRVAGHLAFQGQTLRSKGYLAIVMTLRTRSAPYLRAATGRGSPRCQAGAALSSTPGL